MSGKSAWLSGCAFALAAGLLWGLVFVVPLLLPAYPAAQLSAGRYLAFGLVVLPLAWLDRQRLAQLTRSDWHQALALSAIGNLLYYLCLAGAIQFAGAPLPTLIIGTLPVVIACVANAQARRERQAAWPWRQLAPGLLMIVLGIALVQYSEWLQGTNGGGHCGGPAGVGPNLGPSLDPNVSPRPSRDANAAVGASCATTSSNVSAGITLALCALVCWTWYPLRNSQWLRAHPQLPASTWATAQGLATLPMAALAYLAAVAWQASKVGSGTGLQLWLGTTPGPFVAWMLALGLLASWLGTLCWNEASRRLPPALAGQLILFETLAALVYAYALRQQWPLPAALLGAGALVAGVVLALRLKAQGSVGESQ